ncbi:hypothetical protein [Streptomyces hirsutus]|uniref:hypothetical protein n=1 Tax=Streptomyces hirsutus TaxID=35620 RepID=UPI003666B5DC
MTGATNLRQTLRDIEVFAGELPGFDPSIAPETPFELFSALVEPGFAQIFQRFGRHLNYCGRQAVDAEIKFLGTVHNLNKLINHTSKKDS